MHMAGISVARGRLAPSSIYAIPATFPDLSHYLMSRLLLPDFEPGRELLGWAVAPAVRATPEVPRRPWAGPVAPTGPRGTVAWRGRCQTRPWAGAYRAPLKG